MNCTWQMEELRKKLKVIIKNDQNGSEDVTSNFSIHMYKISEAKIMRYRRQIITD